MAEDGYIPVESATLESSFPGVYAVGDVATVGVPKAGVFAEGAARVVAGALIHRLEHGDAPGPYTGRGSCYIEFGAGRVGRVDIDFLSGPEKTGIFQRALCRAGRREAALRRQPPGPLGLRTGRRSDHLSTTEGGPMSEFITSGAWRPKPGEDDAFIAAWGEFAAWASGMAGAGTLRLMRDLDDPSQLPAAPAAGTPSSRCMPGSRRPSSGSEWAAPSSTSPSSHRPSSR